MTGVAANEFWEDDDIAFKTPYVCAASCDFLSTTVDKLKHHLVTKHTLASDHLCSLCNHRFALFDKFFEHLPSHYKENKLIFKCYTDNCCQLMHRLVDFRMHVNTIHSNSTSFFCCFCFKSKPSCQSILEHVQKHIRNVSKCVYCDAIFFSKEAIFHHLKVDHDGKPRRINLETEVVSYDRLQAQQRSSELSTASTDSGISINTMASDAVYIHPAEELAYQCIQCTYKTNDVDCLGYHINKHHITHNEIFKYNCPTCFYSVDEEIDFIEHVVSHSENQTIQYFFCSYCQEQSSNKKWIEKHIKDNHVDAEVVFTSEDKHFTYLDNLCVCPFCEKICLWKAKLCEHVSLIHGETNLAENIINSPKDFIKEIIFIKYTKSSNILENLIASDNLKIEPEFFQEINTATHENRKEEMEERGVVVGNKKKSRKQSFKCELCPFQCSKFMNFKRHQAIHLKAGLLKTCLKCGYCEFKHSRMNCIKFHLGKYHMNLPIKIISVNDNKETEVTLASNISVKQNNCVLGQKLHSKALNTRDKMLKRMLTKCDLDQYCDSVMPTGMIFKEPVKCTFCEYTNKVRINLKNHMRFHLEERKRQNIQQKETEKKEELGVTLERSSSPEDACNEFENTTHANECSVKRLYKCAYCTMVSKWNKRDIVLHVLHIHMLKKVYSCPYCNFGSSKSNYVVMQHCKQFHEGQELAVRDELKIFNNIAPIKTEGSLIPIAFIADDIGPILTLKELSIYLQISVRKTKYDAHINYDNEDNIKETLDKIKEEKDISHSVLPFSAFPDNSIENTPNNEGNESRDAIDDESNDRLEDFSQTAFIEWKCLFCCHVACEEFSIKKHVLTQHLMCKLFSCPHCKSQYWQEKNVETHIKSTHAYSTSKAIDLCQSKKAVIEIYIEKVIKDPSFPSSRKASFYYCKICSHISSRHDKAKYHVTKKHLKVGLYICSKCSHYSATKMSADRHIEEVHPNENAYPQRSYDVYALFLQDNIQRIANPHPNYSSSTNNEPSTIPGKNSDFFTCSVCNFIAESKLAFSAHSRIHKLYSCIYCDFTTNFLNKIQTHCYLKHPKKPIKHKQISSANFIHHNQQRDQITDNETGMQTNDESAAITTTAKIKIESPFNEAFAKKCEMFKCRLCVYKSNLHAVMRHHVMSHLCYQPYQCPYCTSYTAIRRNVVNNHIKTKHPGLESKTICNRVEEMEIKVKDSYEKISVSESMSKKSMYSRVPIIKSQPRVHRSTHYKCCFCSLSTTFLRDIKQHLMREIDYRPFHCSLCTYKDSSRPVVKRHIGRKHKSASIMEYFLDESDEQLKELLAKCTYVIYKEAQTARSNAKKNVREDKEMVASDIPIVKISTKEDTLESSLVYKRKPHKCTGCDFEDADIRHVLSHRFKCHYSGRKCLHCPHVNHNLLQLRKHVLRCKAKRGGSYVNNYIANNHLLEQNLKNKSYNSESEGNENLESSKEITYCCHECPSTFTNLQEFCSHVQVVHFSLLQHYPTIQLLHQPSNPNEEQLQSCGFCCFQTSCTQTMQKHVRAHTDLQPSKCSLCSHASFTPDHMKRHFQAEHPNNDVVCGALNQPYTMLPTVLKGSIHLFPSVKLADIQHFLS